MTGQISKWDDERGFGFIKTDDHRTGVYCHITAFERINGDRPVIRVGDQVEFELGHSDKGNGIQAVDCELLAR